MATNYRQPGDRLRYKNSGSVTIAAGTPVAFGDALGVAINDIQPGQEGPAGLEGVWELPCEFSAAVPRGQRVYFDAATGKVTDVTTDVPAGFLALDAAADATRAEVKINA